MVTVSAWGYKSLNAFYTPHISGWHQYTVKVGDTLFGLAEASNTGYAMSVEQEIQQHNHLKSAEIYVGQQIEIPFTVARQNKH